jgi:hypothetical protein
MAGRLPDTAKNLDQLEGIVSGPPTYDSYLVSTCHRLRTKPVAEFTVEDLRIMIGQSIGLPYLMPLALDVLEREPLAAGDFYPGDLLQSVLSVSAEYWRREWDLRDRLGRILAEMERVPKELTEAMTAFEAARGPTMKLTRSAMASGRGPRSLSQCWTTPSASSQNDRVE